MLIYYDKWKKINTILVVNLNNIHHLLIQYVVLIKKQIKDKINRINFNKKFKIINWVKEYRKIRTHKIKKHYMMKKFYLIIKNFNIIKII